MKIYINIGHGGADPGAVSTVKEKDLNLAVGLFLHKLLMYIGFTVICSRYDDKTVSMEEACNEANAWGADIFISVHHNAGKGDGAEVYHSIFVGVGREVALLIAEEFGKIGQNVRFVTARPSIVTVGADYYYVIKYTNMPAIITEFAFIDSPADLAQIDELPEQQEEARAIARALCRYAKVNFIEEQPIVAVDYELKYKGLLKALQELYNAYSK